MMLNQALDNIVGDSSWVLQIRQRITQVAGFSYGVLISGPSGTGKELVARAIHSTSSRAAKPFIPVNCAALTGSLFESQLFGHVKGAFTGAEFNSMGCFRAAEGGTIFLDEIGELSLDLQAKLLRAIQDRAVTPVGSHQSVPVDVRIVCATNRDLEEEVRAGRFRLDLYYRLNVISVETTPLKDRTSDIPALVNHFLAKTVMETGSPLKRVAPAALALMQVYDWPGNIRQLQNLIERAVVFSSGDVIGPECFPQLIDAVTNSLGSKANRSTSLPAAACLAAEASTETEASVAAENHEGWSTLADVEQEHIVRTLKQTFYNQSAAARLLGIDRKLLARKIKKYGLRVPGERERLSCD